LAHRSWCDISTDIRIKYGKEDSIDSRLVKINEDDARVMVLPRGVFILNVSKSIKGDNGER